MTESLGEGRATDDLDAAALDSHTEAADRGTCERDSSSLESFSAEVVSVSLIDRRLDLFAGGGVECSVSFLVEGWSL